MNIDFSVILLLAVVITGIISLIDRVWLARKRNKNDKRHFLVEQARGLFPILLLVFVIRSFIVEPFRIPSGSLEPTLLIGDFVLVNKYDYGLRSPITNTKLIAIKAPKTGDIVVFRYPLDPKIAYIKRIIGVPGDHIQYKNKVLSINGKKAAQTYQGEHIDSDTAGNTWLVKQYREQLNGVQHSIYINPIVPVTNFSITVPKDKYFVMGDNRDDSQDSRYFGFVPDKNLIGKAFVVWFSWNNHQDKVRWQRIGGLIK